MYWYIHFLIEIHENDCSQRERKKKQKKFQEDVLLTKVYFVRKKKKKDYINETHDVRKLIFKEVTYI